MTRLSADTSGFDAVTLPEAMKERWQPIRGGLLNLYLYDYEEFRYDNGHLILRGNNGTGKSRVMALQLPFLFDGTLSANRVEPDADPSKRMEWNLLMGRHSERLGYTWVEFGKRLCVGDNGSHPEQQFITLGCGLSATKSSGMRDPWFFVTEQRVGKDLFLQSDAGHALSKSGLTDAIGERGRVYTTARDYRQAVDAALFGLGKQRYEAMVDLLIQLRKPQLSRNLDEQMLARVLGEALPPPSELMINDVAESFRSLESDRMELHRFQSARDGVDSFLKTYRRYAQIASRRRAARVRSAHNSYEYASKELRKAEKAHRDATAELDKTSRQLRKLVITSEETESRIKALSSDPRMRSADSINEAGAREREALRDLEAAKEDLGTAKQRLAERHGIRKSAFEEAESKLKQTKETASRARKLAAESALRPQHEAAFASLSLVLAPEEDSSSLSTDQVRAKIAKAVSTRARGAEQLKKRDSELHDAEAVLRRAKSARDDAQSALSACVEVSSQCESKLHQEIDAFLDAYEMWRRDSDELVMPVAESVRDTLTSWSEELDAENPLSAKLSGAQVAAKEAIGGDRLDAVQRHQELTAEQRKLADRIQALQHGYHEPPQLPAAIDPETRDARLGAPFWSLVDFHASVSTDVRANVEAALELAGFLTAWVTTDGKVLSADFQDVVLTVQESPSSVRDDETLATILKPTSDINDHSVPQIHIASVLRFIRLRDENATTWIAEDGHWRNGPLRGHASKKSAQFIGHEAREQHRLHQLKLATVELSDLSSEVESVQRDLASLDARLAAIDNQVDSFPRDAEIRSTAASLSYARRRTSERRSELASAAEKVVVLGIEVEDVRKTRDEAAQDLGLEEWVGRGEGLIRNIASYQQSLEGFWPSVAHFESLRVRYADAARDVREAKKAAQRRETFLHDQETRHAKAAEHLATLRETIGVEADEILAQLERAEEAHRKLKTRIDAAQDAKEKAGNQVARTEERITARKKDIDQASAARETSCDSFKRLCWLGLLEVSTRESTADDANDWSISKTVEIARKTEGKFSHVNADDGAWDRVQQSVTSTVQGLNTALSQHAFTSTLTTTDELYLVTVPYQGKDRSVHDLRALLAEEVEQRQLVLDEREREIIENHLIGEVATQLHEQIHHALEMVEKMNAEIKTRPMSTGMMLKFDWKPDDSLSSGIVTMCRKLLGTSAAWSPDERAAIGRYLQDHIKDVRAARESGAWHEHLAEALDYRKWHRFWVMRKQDTGWKRLTKRTHGTGSGGEKAVALTIPQFAAAAAHYSSAREDAPRLILLDEAFVGIDPDMRGKCMELIDVFDLDFMLTSESEWGCYASLPGVAIYQLSTSSGIDAVFVTRWVWNGNQKVRQEVTLPPATPMG